MPHITTILANEVGVQHQGIQDASILIGVPVVSGLIVGKFKRGRFDRPMVITGENVRALLGHDPSNPDYNVVLDALALGVPSVQVLRLEGQVDGSNPNPNSNPNPDPEPEPNGSPTAVVGISTVGMGTVLTFDFEVNGTLYPNLTVGIDSASYGFATLFLEEPLKSVFQGLGIMTTFDSTPAAFFTNQSNLTHTIRITAKDAQSDATMFDIFGAEGNPYVQDNLRHLYNDSLRKEGRTISFKLTGRTVPL